MRTSLLGPFGWRIALRALRAEPQRAAVLAVVSGLCALVFLAMVVVAPVTTAQLGTTERLQPVKGAAKAPVEAAFSEETYRGEEVTVVWVAQHGDEGITIPGISSIPEKGSMLLSPALRSAVARDDTLAARYPWSDGGSVGEEILVGPQTLLAVVRTDAAEVRARGGAPVARFARPGTTDLSVSSEVRVGAPVIGVMMLVPLVWLVVVIATIGSRRRGVRAQALSESGFRPRQTAAIEVAQTAITSGLGSVAFVLAALATRGWWGPRVPLGDGIWPADLTISPIAAGTAVLGPPLVLVTGLLLALRSGSRQERRAPRWSRILAVGLLAVASLVASALWPDPDAVDIRLALLVVAALAGVVATIALGRRGGGLAPRTRPGTGLVGLLARAGRGSSGIPGVATGVALLMATSAVLLSVFPLLTSVGSDDRAAAVRAAGPDTFVLTLDPAVTSGEVLERLAETPGVQRAVSLRERGTAITAWCPSPSSTGCDADELADLVPPVLTARGLPPSSVRPPTRPTRATTAIVTAAPASVEDVRSVILREVHPTGLRQMTLGEDAAYQARSSRPFVIATWCMVGLAALVSVSSLIAGLVGHVLTRARSWGQLVATGVRPAILSRALMTEVVTVAAPLISIGCLLGIALAWAFLRLNDSAQGPPVATVGVLGLVGLIAAVLSAAALHPWVRSTVYGSAKE